MVKLLHSRLGAAIMILIAVTACAVAYTHDVDHRITASGVTIVFSPPGAWSLPAWLSLSANIALNIIVCLLMMQINGRYNVLRTLTMLPVGLFALIQAANPALLLNLNSGTILAVVILTAQLLLFDCYDAPARMRPVFLIFAMLSLGASTAWCYIVFIPLFILGCIQMRIFSLRAALAAGLGIITVWWIIFGFGWVDPRAISLTPPWQHAGAGTAANDLSTLITAGVTAFLTFAAILLNVMRTIAYNARARAFNGALTLTAVFTVTGACLNFANLADYIPLLNCCAAFQISHFFTIHRTERSYIGILAVTAVYLTLYIWQLLI